METNNYLTQEKKLDYMVDFNHLLTIDSHTRTDAILDPEIREILIEINNNELIHTLSSAFMGNSNKSIICFAYHLRIEQELKNNIIPNIIKCVETIAGRRSIYIGKCSRNYFLPSGNLKCDPRNPKYGIRYFDDKDYYRINHISIFFGANRNEQEANRIFWNCVRKGFSMLTES